MNVLLVGSGGREHAMAWAVTKSTLLKKLFAAPGNAGIAELATCLPIEADDVDGIVKAAQNNAIDFVIVGPEVPLVKGLVDALEKVGIPAFGPKADAAQLEGSKGFMKDLCARAGVPTAAYARFTEMDKALSYARAVGAPIVIKADGLAAGKGVTVAMTLPEAEKAIHEAMESKVFGAAGTEVVIEEYMDGEEASFFALVDGATAIPFADAQDHKRVFDGDKGPNTGGMGAYSPAPIMTATMTSEVMRDIVLPTAQALAAKGMPFRGVMFAGLMLTRSGPRLIEFNARFGDPETQAMLPRLKSDFLDVLYKTATGRLKDVKLEWHDTAALCVVMAANGYPGAYKKKTPIKGLENANAVAGAVVFHAGTANENGQVLATGGRVLGVTGFDATVGAAQKNAYAAVDRIVWPDGFCRRDIGWRAINKG